MTREQAKQNLVGFGIEEPTEEQITNYLNQIGGETRRERERADKYKEDAGKVSALQKQLDDLQNADKTDLQKAQDRIAELEKTNAKNERMQRLAELGITGENAEKLIGDEGISFETLGQIISDREKASALAKEQEIAGKQGNPDGGNAGGKTPEKTESEKVAENIGKNISASVKASSDVLANYI